MSEAEQDADLFGTAGLDEHETREALRVLEAVLFAASEPLDPASLAERLPPGHDIERLLAVLSAHYAGRGVNLVRRADKWAFRTAPDLGYALAAQASEPRRLSRAAFETLAIIAYHQPVTRAEIEEIRGVSAGKGTFDLLLETGWIRMRGRRRSPGRPVTYGTTDAFVDHFGLESLADLPGLDELKGAGLLDSRLPPDFRVPNPDDALGPDEDPLDESQDEEDEEAARDDRPFATVTPRF